MMGIFKFIATERRNIADKIEKTSKEISDDEIIDKLIDLGNDIYMDIVDNEEDDNIDNIKKYVSVNRSIHLVENLQRIEKKMITAFTIMLVTMITTIIIGTVSTIYYKNELQNAIKTRQEDLKNISYWIEENNSLKKEYEDLQSKYDYAVEYIRTNEKYNLPKELEE